MPRRLQAGDRCQTYGATRRPWAANASAPHEGRGSWLAIQETPYSPAEGIWRSGCSEVAAERFADQLGGGGSLGLGALEQLAAEFRV